MKEMQQAINNAFEKMNSEGVIQKIIEAQLVDTVKRAIHDSIQDYSPFGSALKDAIKKAVECDIKDFGLAGYRDTVFKIVRDRIDATFEEEVTAKLGKDIDELLKPAPAEICLSALIDVLKEDLENEFGHGEITFIAEDSSYSSRWIYIDPEGGKDKYDCEIQFLLRDGGGPISALHVRGKKNLDRQIIYGRHYGFERLLFRLVVAETKVIPDIDEVCKHFGDL